MSTIVRLPPRDQVIGLRTSNHLERLDAHQRPKAGEEVVHSLDQAEVGEATRTNGPIGGRLAHGRFQKEMSSC